MTPLIFFVCFRSLNFLSSSSYHHHYDYHYHHFFVAVLKYMIELQLNPDKGVLSPTPHKYRNKGNKLTKVFFLQLLTNTEIKGTKKKRQRKKKRDYYRLRHLR